MEKLGLGPEALAVDNPGLVYARLTGFGQTGPYRDMAGHDINYLAVSGVLSSLGRKHENPLAPVNLLADFAGGSFVCALGILAALLERGQSGRGQVVDSCMVEGAAYVGSWLFASRDMFVWGKSRGNNFLDSGAHFYETYRTKDNKYLAVGALEPHFYSKFLEGLGVSDDDLPQFGDPDEMKAKLAAIIANKTQADWCAIFDGTDACVTPVLDQAQAVHHPHNLHRGAFLPGGMPRPAPLLSRTPAQPESLECTLVPGQHSREILSELGYTRDRVDSLLQENIVAEAAPRAKL